MRRLKGLLNGSALRASGTVVATMVLSNALMAQSLTWLGTLGGDSWALGVSADGRVVVGRARNASGRLRAFRWDSVNGMQDLGTLGGNESWANGVSADGSVVVGLAKTSLYDRAFRWENGVMQDLGTLGGCCSYANGVSADGSVVVGMARNDRDYGRAFRWENGLMQNLGTLGGNDSQAFSVSADGSVVAGVSSGRAFRWENGVMQDLGTLPGGTGSVANGVSADGSVVVGTAQLFGGYTRAFRWENGVMQNLGTLGGAYSYAYGVSADGSVVVGQARTGSGSERAFRWTASGGMEDLNTTYASLLTSGSYLNEARAISPDGRFIVGHGRNGTTGRGEGFLLDTGPTCTAHSGDVDNNGCVDDADLLAVLFAFGSTGSNLGRVDVNCDETVDDADLLQVLFNFGSGC